ncbi:UvrD-helicase domain-containing protein [Streptomyces sp. DSM 44917]|uniref:DNA 3'-5' helicase n=1 Tax=Streptomyces boetiae TaxID=3075541 RepID=A0ABU2L7X2_9ACTN|nr:UvrD-helicase domain-containing protein [Streptomyces sp. DSM 44917]MDT0307669.1 UvrD-helicase domain-containing protein [Streptomyces sp. DSM 44917]
MRTPLGEARVPTVDAARRAVVDHRGGPLLVLAGPGTGKTATLVEAVARRVEGGTDPERVLVLTFSRKAAVELRDRLAARLEGTAPAASTFHSFAYALVRAHQDRELFAEPLRLLTGPEQDLYLRELLAGHRELERAGLPAPAWPEELRACLTTRGFADELRAVLARSRELGLDPERLAAFARRTGRPDWEAAARFMAEYLDVTQAQGVLDYAGLVRDAARLLAGAKAAAEVRARYDAVFVDEYQDTDPAQAELLRALAGNGRDLMVFGDPDQSIYAFRGADVGGILGFPDAFRTADGRPAPVAVLTTGRRSGAALLAATRQVAQRMPLARLPAEAVRRHRALTAEREGGRVEVFTYPTPGAELENIADLLRRAHLEDGVPWGEMAVLVRAGARSLPGVRRALTSAGVPVEVDGEDLPLHQEPAVAPLLAALQAIAGEPSPDEAPPPTAEEPTEAPGTAVAQAASGGSAGSADPAHARAPEGVDGGAAVRGGGLADEASGAGDGPATRRAAGPGPAGGGLGAQRNGPPGRAPEDAADAAGVGRLAFDAESAARLLTSPLGGMDAADLRRLGRALRNEERAAGAAVPPPSGELIARALAEPERLVAHDPAYARGAQRLGLLLRKARELLEGGGTAEEALWLLWDGTGWPERLERAALRGGAAGRNADRDLDAVCALFEVAAHAEERTGGRGARNFLSELQAHDIAADTLHARAARPDAVRLMTAHRAKGLEWSLVVVAGVQEGLWPDLRRRGSLLEADRIGRDGLAEPLTPAALLAEERRLFYVAVTRAKERLVVTAVRGAEDGDQPSRFLRELGVEPQEIAGRPRRPLSPAALVAELRATTVDPAASPALRRAAARRLAELAALTDEDGHALVPAAHPDRWWGLRRPTRSPAPLRDPEEPVALSGSALGQLANACSLQWFLGREAHAEPPATTAQGFGNVLHVLADEVASGTTPADLSVLMERLETVWDSLAFEAPWQSRRERTEARAALERFLRWHVAQREAGREPVASEAPFDITLEAGEHRVRIRGVLDRVERDAEGRAYVVDFKTGRTRPTGAEVERHPQLAVYQLAVRHGEREGGDGAGGGPWGEPGGAELVHLRQGAARRDGGEALPAVQRQQPPGAEGGDWVAELLTTAAGRVLDERFGPATGQQCGACSFRGACSARPEGRQVVE